MRLAPVVIRYHSYFPARVELLLDLAEESSLPTHASLICRSACRYLALLLAGLVHGLSQKEVLDPDWAILQRAGHLHPSIKEIASGGYRGKSIGDIRSGGYVVDSLEAALWAFHGSEDFRGAVLRA